MKEEGEKLLPVGGESVTQINHVMEKVNSKKIIHNQDYKQFRTQTLTERRTPAERCCSPLQRLCEVPQALGELGKTPWAQTDEGYKNDNCKEDFTWTGRNSQLRTWTLENSMKQG